MAINPYQKAEEIIKDTTSQAPVESVYTPVVKSVLYTEAVRIQRIVSALYLITDFFNEAEPLKGHIRSTGVLLISQGHVPEGTDIKDIIGALSRMISSCDLLMSFTDIARLTQKISDMNATIVTRELTTMHMHLSKRYHEFLDQEKELAQRVVDKDTTSLENFFNDAPSLVSPEQSPSWYPTSMRTHTPVAQTSVLGNMSKGQVAKSEPLPETPEEIKENRKRQIIDLIKDRGEVSIKDIAPRILKCSEKTLQRDLQELISNKTLKKTGDRRWSKYSLNI